MPKLVWILDVNNIPQAQQNILSKAYIRHSKQGLKISDKLLQL